MRKALKSSLVSSAAGQVANNGPPGGGDTILTVDSPWVARLLVLHREVRNAVAKATRTGTGSRNAKGDEVTRGLA